MLAVFNEWLDNGGISNFADGTQPFTTPGTAVTPVQNAYGSYTQLLSATAYETFWIEININQSFATAVAREAVITIGVDEAGGTSYVDTISHLICGHANLWFDPAEWMTSGGINYAFPLRIKAGSTIAAKASVSTASVAAFQVMVRLRGKPSRPELLWAGKSVETLGSVSASTFGTAVTFGTASEGAWTQIGAGSPSKKWRYVEFGYGLNDAAMSPTRIEIDIGIGDATNKRVILRGSVHGSQNETVRKDQNQGVFVEDAISALCYARGQSSGGPPSNTKIALYGVA